MFTIRGIAMDVMIKVDGDCPLGHEVVGEEVHFRFGGERSSGLTLVCTIPAFMHLVAEINAAARFYR